MSQPFTLQVPADERYRGLAPEVAGRYAELSGGGPADAAALAEAITGAIERLAPAASADLELRFRTTGLEVEVTLRCGTGSSTITHALAAPRR